jgi:hypothetical protein
MVGLIYHYEFITCLEKHNSKLPSQHDCFGTSANDCDTLVYLVKNAFIAIYANDDFI